MLRRQQVNTMLERCPDCNLDASHAVGLSLIRWQAGAFEVVVKIGEQSVIVRLWQSTAPEKPLEQDEEIVL